MKRIIVDLVDQVLQRS